jgi:phospholipase/lecithinase/hemolysin
MRRMASKKSPLRKTFTQLLCKAALIIAPFVADIPLHAQLPDLLPPSSVRLQFVVFGDSLLDAGTYSPVAAIIFGGGRFTTNPGRIFIQDVARHYGDKLTPAFVGGFGIPLLPAGGLDFAQGGSRVKLQPGFGHAAEGTPHADFSQATTIPIRDQVITYLAAHKKFSSDQVVFINGGADDVFINLQAAQSAGTPAAQQAAVEAITQSATDLVDIVGTVLAHGAKHVALMNLPDLGTTPEGAASADHGQSLTEISQLFNQTLIGALQQRNLINQVILIDTFAVIDDIITNFQQNGFTVSNTGTACNLNAQVEKATQLHLNNPTAFGDSLFCSPATFNAKNADQTFMFADTVHPTTHLGSLFAQSVEKQFSANGLGH